MHFWLFLVLQLSLIFLVIVSRWVYLYSIIMTWLHCHGRLLFLVYFSSFPHCPWVWPLVRITAYIQITLLSDNIVAIYPLGILILDLSSTLATTPLMANDLASAPQHYFTVSLLVSKHNGLVPLSPSPIVIFGLFFLFSSFPMSVTTCSDHCLHPNNFADW